MTLTKLTWHDGNQVWCKVIGKKLSKDKAKLVQAQWYFTPNREESETLAAARKAEWRKLKKGWPAHQVLLDTMAEPFSLVPHWYGEKFQQESKLGSSRDEDIAAFRQLSEPTQSEAAEMYQDMNVAECAAMFMLHRKGREGIDFKPTTNKSFKIDLDAALRAIDNGLRMIDLMPADLESQRVKLIRECASTNTATNYGRAMRMMLDWYYNSVYFYGGTAPKGISEIFSRYPKKRPAKPNHLTFDTLKTILSAASERRRLFLLLMLNTGMQPTDIPHLDRTAFDLDRSIVRWHRQKNERVKNPADHEITSHLWPETAALVRHFLSNQPGPAFRNVDGKPLFHESKKNNRQNAVTKGLAKFFKKVNRDHTIKASPKNFRQTGAQLIHEITDDYQLSQIWLGRKFKIVDRPYLRQVYERLNDASTSVRAKLLAAGALTFAATSKTEAAT